MQALSLFLAGSLALLAAPGPTNALLAACGALGGVRGGLGAVAAALAGYALSVSIAALLLTRVVETHPALATGLRAAIAAVLVWTAVRLWRHSGAGPQAGMAVTARQVFAATLLNPKALVLAYGLVPLPGPSLVFAVPVLALLIAGCGTGWVILGHWAGRTAGGQRASRSVARAAALVLAGFAGGLVLAG